MAISPGLRLLRIASWLVAIPTSVVLVTAVGLRCCGLLIPYRIPTAAMHPTIQRDDQIFMEGITYLTHKPARGDVLVFRTRDIPAIGTNEDFVKRLVGLPGEKLRISGGQLFVNGQPVSLRDADHALIRYVNGGRLLANPTDKFLVPPDSYFVLGDNSVNSADSRYWGVVPKRSVRGRVWFRYWPWR